MEKISGSGFRRLAAANVERVLLVAVAGMSAGAYMGQPAIVLGQVALIAAVIFAFSLKLEHADFITEIRPSAWCVLLVAMFWALSVAVHWEDYSRPVSVLKKLRYLLLPVLCVVLFRIRFLLVRNAVRYARAGLIAVAVAVCVASVVGLIGYWSGFHPIRFGAPPDPHRVNGVHGNAMTYGYSMQLAILLLLGVALLHFSDRSLWKLPRKLLLLAIASVVVGLVGLYFSFTRGGVLGLFVGGAILLFTTRSWKLLFSLSGAAIFVLVVAFATNARFVSDLSSSNLERQSQWRFATIVALKYPAIGVGYRQLEQNGDKLKEELRLPKDRWETVEGREVASHYVSHAHNNYLEVFASGGVFAGLAFLGFCISWARETWESGLGRLLFLPSVAAFIVSGFFECTFLDGEVLTMIMLLYVASQITLDLEASEPGAGHSAS